MRGFQCPISLLSVDYGLSSPDDAQMSRYLLQQWRSWELVHVQFRLCTHVGDVKRSLLRCCKGGVDQCLILLFVNLLPDDDAIM
jgi:hypothetical protein